MIRAQHVDQAVPGLDQIDRPQGGWRRSTTCSVQVVTVDFADCSWQNSPHGLTILLSWRRRRELNEQSDNTNTPTPPPVEPPVSVSAAPTKTNGDRRRTPRRGSKSPVLEFVKIVLGGIAGLALAYGILLLGFDIDVLEQFNLRPTAATKQSAMRPANSEPLDGEAATIADGGEHVSPDRSTSVTNSAPTPRENTPGDSFLSDQAAARSESHQNTSREEPQPDETDEPEITTPIAPDPFTRSERELQPDNTTASDQVPDSERSTEQSKSDIGEPQADASTPAVTKQAVPAIEQQTAVLEKLRDIFQQEYAAATTSASQTNLASRLKAEASKVDSDPVARFVLLREAYNFALSAGDYDLAESLARDLSTAFEVDFLSVMVHLLTNAIRSAQGPDARHAVATKCIDYVPTLLEAHRFDEAFTIASGAEELATRIRAVELRRRADALASDAQRKQREWATVQAAMAKLREAPDDAKANLIVGRHLCCDQRDWSRGLPRLAKGSDDRIAVAAQLDLAGAESPAGQLKIADAWYEIGRSRDEDSGFIPRAHAWYRQAERQLSGIDKLKAEKRLRELANFGSTVPHEAPIPLAIAPFDAATAKQHQRNWAEHLGLPVERKLDLPGGEKLVLVLIPPGEFLMGSSERERDRFLAEAKANQNEWLINNIWSEGPQHRVRISRAFYLGKHEMTQSQWEAVMGSNPSRFAGNPSHPVELISWEDTQPMLTKLNRLSPISGGEFALPTAAQWEYACRAGTITVWHFGDSGVMLPQYAWFKENAGGKTHPVGKLKPNAWGLFDLHGNVREYCADWYAGDYYKRSPSEDPVGPPEGFRRVARGGCWSFDGILTRSANRFQPLPDHRLDYMGLRLAFLLKQE